MFKKYIAIFLALLLCCSLIVFVGCGKSEESTENDDTYTEEVEENGGGVSTTSGKTVTMNGRSVMEGWMSHWGYDWEGPVGQNGYALDYKALDSDLSNIANSFRDNVEGLPEGSVVFFKFCFADFYGDNLSQLEDIIDEVVQTASDRNLNLIIGNALPMHKQDSSSEHVSEYEAYNLHLEEVASGHDNVWVYDFYGVLAGDDGFLKEEYDTGDSHPNDDAYEALDPSFFSLLNQIF